MKPVPVLLMARSLDLGGTERQMTEIARSLDRSRFEPHVGCFHAGGLRGEELRASGVPVVELPVRSFRSLSVLEGVRVMSRYVSRHAIQIVHTFDAPLTVYGVPAARLCGVPWVISSQRAHRELVSRPLRHLLRLTDHMVDAIVVNAHAVERELIESEKVPPSLVHLCYNGIDTQHFQRQAGERPEALRDATLVIGVVCAIRSEKGLPGLLQAFARIRGLRPGLKLVVVGSGPALDELEQTRRTLDLGDSCVLEPATCEVARWLSAIDIFVLPSLSEGLPNSLMEAMACGCCVAASRVGGNPELVQDGQTGLLFESGNVQDLTATLQRLLECEELRRSLSSAAVASIRQGFSLEASSRRMGQIYEYVLSSQTPGKRSSAIRYG